MTESTYPWPLLCGTTLSTRQMQFIEPVRFDACNVTVTVVQLDGLYRLSAQCGAVAARQVTCSFPPGTFRKQLPQMFVAKNI
jgi:hypothetical protein